MVAIMVYVVLRINLTVWPRRCERNSSQYIQEFQPSLFQSRIIISPVFGARPGLDMVTKERKRWVFSRGIYIRSTIKLFVVAKVSRMCCITLTHELCVPNRNSTKSTFSANVQER
jgi:hypothetical protein